jgi:hypothetical protein
MPSIKQIQDAARVAILPFIIKGLIKDNTIGDLIDLKSLAKELHIQIKLDNELKDLCRISIEKDSRYPTIYLNPACDTKTKHTFVAIAIAEYILTPDRVSGPGINYDLFFLKAIYSQKHNYYMLLSTRLTFPEKTITLLEDQSINSDDFINNSNYLPQFIRCCVSDSSSLFLLETFSELSN